MTIGAATLNVPVGEGAAEKLFLYCRELERWNRRVNLVSRKQPDWVRVHFLDSLVPLSMGLLEGEERLVDLGAGAGFPGLPLKIVRPSLTLVMVESSGKKCAFLRHVVRTLNLSGAEVAEGRFDRVLEGGMAGSFDVAVSRAAAKPGAILKAAAPFLAEEGRAMIFTSESLASRGPGTIHPYRLPGSDLPTVIWLVEARDMR